MEKKKSLMPHSSCGSEASIIDMALPMCVKPEETKKKKSMMPFSSFASKASTIDMVALPMCVKPEETNGVSVDKCNVGERDRVLLPSTLPSCSLQHRSPSTSEPLTQVLTRLHDRR